MEALVAASVAALTVYDMAKAIDKGMVVTDITLVEKTKVDAEERRSDRLGRRRRGTREDKSGDLLVELLAADGYEVERRVVPDEAGEIATAIARARARRRRSCSRPGVPASPRGMSLRRPLAR